MHSYEFNFPLFLYSPGAMPVISLNAREKLCIPLNPMDCATFETVIL